jgi:outer membrane biosynthesis protein TonB
LREKIVVGVLVLVLAWMVTPRHASGQTASESARKVVLRVAPQYPSLARSMNIQGIVKAGVLVAPNGTAKSIEIREAIPSLTQSVQNALHDWKWEPASHETHKMIELPKVPALILPCSLH